MAGTLALVGGNEWRDGCTFDRGLLETAGTNEVLVVPTAAAFEGADRAVEHARAWFESLGATVEALDVLHRAEATDPDVGEAVRKSRFVYLSGGSPLHLRSVLKDSPLWDALVHAWNDGTVIAGSSAGAMVLCDPMVDPRGGAFTVGLGLVTQMAVIPHFEEWSHDKAHRAIELAEAGIPVVGLEAQTALLRDPAGTWRVEGAGRAIVYLDGAESDLSALPT